MTISFFYQLFNISIRLTSALYATIEAANQNGGVFMKLFISLVLAGVMTAVSVTFSSPTVTAETEHHDNVLITYFSRARENYNVGVVERGNTDLLAGIVAEETGGELFRIETVKEYPSAYDEMLTVATEERTNKERPELKTSVWNFDTYDVIFVGYPIW